MKKTILLLLTAMLLLSGCIMGMTESTAENTEIKENEVEDKDAIRDICCLYGINITLPKGYKEMDGINRYNLYNFALRGDLYIMVHYFPNEFDFSHDDFAALNAGYFMTNYQEKEKSQQTKTTVNGIDIIEFTYKKSYDREVYSGAVYYIEVDGGIAALDIYRKDLEFSDRDKISADEIIDTISLNDVAFVQGSTNTYDIGDKEITLSEHWNFRDSSQAGNMIYKNFTYEPLSIAFTIMWHNSGIAQSDEQMIDYFAQTVDIDDLFETSIGDEEGYYSIRYDRVKSGLNLYGTAICTTGGIYDIFIISADDLELPDEAYHNCVKMLEESVSMK